MDKQITNPQTWTDEQWKEAIGDFVVCIHCSAPIVKEITVSGLVGGIECSKGHISSHKWLVKKQREIFLRTTTWHAH